ncbi:MAG: class II aldolase/adducin family protein, partial [Oscillospiraceae bacterium]|nr:class II aldolase/adducin family protein [Oscillospiraceae bacterium]
MSKYAKLKKEVLACALQSYREQLFAGTSGNLSIYDPQLGAMIITPSGLPYETMTAKDLMVITLSGEVLEGKNRPSSEWRMHAEIYKKCPEIRALVHTHSPYATSFAVSDEAIPVILIEMGLFLGGDVRVARFGLPGTVDVGLNALEALPQR